MNSTFFETSKGIADKFLQTVVLIDDQAYRKPESVDSEHDLNADLVTRNFAKSNKLCSVYRPEKVEDLDYLNRVAQKADIIILDWKLHLTADENTALDDEDIVDEVDPRGEHTIPMIDSILSNPQPGASGVKLVVIYTGETDLAGIANIIFERLKTKFEVQSGDFEITALTFKIVVIGKPTLKVKHVTEIEQRIIDYSDLPDFILTEFTKITSGLVSDFILNSLCILRSNTSRLLQLFSNVIDPAFVSHCALLPNWEDAKEQLIEMFINSVSALLNYNKAGDILTVTRFGDWLDSQYLDEHLLGKSIEIDDDISIDIDIDFLKKWIESDFIKASTKKIKTLNNGRYDPDRFNRILNFIDRGIHKNSTQYFTISQDFLSLDSTFSILTHQKSLLKLPSQAPRLSLGSILKKDSNYYVCIQQKCDSVRIRKPRNFIFLPLKIADPGNDSFHFVINEPNGNIHLSLSYKTFDILLINFKANAGEDVIKAQKSAEGNNYVFKADGDVYYLWVSDLKDAHAQRLANEFAAKISRVGLDESEWLRRWGSNS